MKEAKRYYNGDHIVDPSLPYQYKIYDLEYHSYGGRAVCECCGYENDPCVGVCQGCLDDHQKQVNFVLQMPLCRPLQWHSERHEVVCYDHDARTARYKGKGLYTCAEDGHNLTVKLIKH